MPKKRRRVKVGRIILGILILLLITAGSFTFYAYSALRPMGQGNIEKEFEIQEGESLSTVLEDLQKEDLIKNSTIASLYAKMSGHETHYAGTYLLKDNMSLQEILAYIADPSNIMAETIHFTIPEGTWAKEIAANLSQVMPYSQEEILQLWNDPAYIQELSKTYSFIDPSILDNEQLKVKLEGYLYPETYYLDKDMSLDAITRAFLDQFNIVYQENKEAFEQSGMSVEQVVTLASIIQFESGSVEDMKTISGVFHNRLQQNMKLESSVTVCYALYEDFKDASDCETRYDVDSPYNTYQVEGLPPGPILNTGKEAILAALSPEENDYLFFAADIHNVKSNPGKVYYSKTYEEHEQIVKDLKLVIE